jgi:hypothetical protein
VPRPLHGRVLIVGDKTVDFIDAAIALHAGEGNPRTVLQHLVPLIDEHVGTPRLVEALFPPAGVAEALQHTGIEYRQRAFAQYVNGMYARRGWQTERHDGHWLLWNGQPSPATTVNIFVRHPAPVEEVRGAAAVFGLAVLPATPDSHWWHVRDPGPVRGATGYTWAWEPA